MLRHLANTWDIADAVDVTLIQVAMIVMTTIGIRIVTVVTGTPTQDVTIGTTGTAMATEGTAATGGTVEAPLPPGVAVDATLQTIGGAGATLEARLVAAAPLVMKGGTMMRRLAPLLRRMGVNHVGEHCLCCPRAHSSLGTGFPCGAFS